VLPFRILPGELDPVRIASKTALQRITSSLVSLTSFGRCDKPEESLWPTYSHRSSGVFACLKFRAVTLRRRCWSDVHYTGLDFAIDYIGEICPERRI